MRGIDCPHYLAYHRYYQALMKAAFLICCILAVALFGLSCAPEAALDVSVGDDTMSVTAILIENGVRIENVGDVGCIVFVRSPEGEQQFELAAGKSITVTDITEPIEIAAVGL